MSPEVAALPDSVEEFEETSVERVRAANVHRVASRLVGGCVNTPCS
jgi:hypothetical protein